MVSLFSTTTGAPQVEFKRKSASTTAVVGMEPAHHEGIRDDVSDKFLMSEQGSGW
jgi:hypothetical protein